jgi:hypothetical protein
VLHVGNDRGRLAFQLLEPVDLLPDARREVSLGSQMLLQSFADFSTDCSAVGVINVDGVAHDGPRCPGEPPLRLMKVLETYPRAQSLVPS